MARELNNREYFDVGYGIVPVGITATGVTVIATTAGNYHGVVFIASAAALTAKVYDASVGTTGNIVDIVCAATTGTGWSDKYIPIVCKKGITISVTGTGGVGTVFYGPKG